MPFTWSWAASCSPDVAFYVLLAARVLLTGWTPCPTEEWPDHVCPVYELTEWVLVGETPGLSMVDPLPVSPAGSVSLLTVEAVDLADQRSEGETGCP
jgi:hypothetical protein